MKRSTLKVRSFLTVSLVSVCLAQGAFADEENLQEHPFLHEETSWETHFLEDVPTLENKATTRYQALEILSAKDQVGAMKELTEDGFSLGSVSEAVGGAITQVMKAPVSVVGKARHALTGLNPLNLFHADKVIEEEVAPKLDNSILSKELEMRSRYSNRSYDEWFANQTADALASQKPAPKEKQKMKIQILLQDFISTKDK